MVVIKYYCDLCEVEVARESFLHTITIMWKYGEQIESYVTGRKKVCRNCVIELGVLKPDIDSEAWEKTQAIKQDNIFRRIIKRIMKGKD